MSVKFWWHNEAKNIFVIQTVGDWTLEEYYTVFTEAVAEMERVQHAIILINDVTKSAAPPRNFLSTAQFSKNHKAQNIRLTIMAGTHIFIRRMVLIFATIVPGFVANLSFAETLEQAVLDAEKMISQTMSSH